MKLKPQPPRQPRRAPRRATKSRGALRVRVGAEHVGPASRCGSESAPGCRRFDDCWRALERSPSALPCRAAQRSVAARHGGDMGRGALHQRPRARSCPRPAAWSERPDDRHGRAGRASRASARGGGGDRHGIAAGPDRGNDRGTARCLHLGDLDRHGCSGDVDGTFFAVLPRDDGTVRRSRQPCRTSSTSGRPRGS